MDRWLKERPVTIDQIGRQIMWLIISWLIISFIVALVFGAAARRSDKGEERELKIGGTSLNARRSSAS